MPQTLGERWSGKITRSSVKLDLLTPSKEREYFLGLLITDGSVQVKGRTSFIRFSSTDEDLTEAFRFCLGNGAHITKQAKVRRSWRARYRVNANCGNVAGVLFDYGIVPNKCGKEVVPDTVDSSYFWHFFRGVLDGDGCIYLRDGEAGRIDILSPSLVFIEKLREFVLKRVDVKCSVGMSSGVWRLNFGRKASETILPLVYKDSAGLRSHRKYKKGLYAANPA